MMRRSTDIYTTQTGWKKKSDAAFFSQRGGEEKRGGEGRPILSQAPPDFSMPTRKGNEAEPPLATARGEGGKRGNLR